jgi:hypothetical protein
MDNKPLNLNDPNANTIVLSAAGGKELLRIDLNGNVTLGKNVDLNEASELFYNNIVNLHTQHVAGMKQLQECLEAYEEALKFYADPRTYLGVRFLENPTLPLIIDSSFVVSIDEKNPDIQMMPGKKARVALGVENG